MTRCASTRPISEFLVIRCTSCYDANPTLVDRISQFRSRPRPVPITFIGCVLHLSQVIDRPEYGFSASACGDNICMLEIFRARRRFGTASRFRKRLTGFGAQANFLYSAPCDSVPPSHAIWYDLGHLTM